LNLDIADSLAIRFRTTLLAAFALPLAISCSGDESAPTETEDPTGLTIVAGNAQTGTAGEELEDPLIVRVTTVEGEPIEGATVTWAVTTGGGAIEPEPIPTDVDGRAEARWTLGGAVGEQTVTVTSAGLSAVFRATAGDSQRPSAIVIASGDDQRAAAGSQLANPLVVRVENEFGRPIAGIEVEWNVESGGGIITPTTTSTDSDGQAQVQWTLGLTGQQSALASVGGLSARFRAAVGTPR
jgi:hypothetical protein